MPIPRNQQISISDTPYYRCVSRCVRRTFLCGEDSVTGKNYSHRKQWIINRLTELAHIFAIDVCAFAVMSNHTHLVLKINLDTSQAWSEKETIERWTALFSTPVLIERYSSGLCTGLAETQKAQQLIDTWRERLADISWFMRCLNEHIARRANAEDNCTGRFWEGRFKSQALLNEQALLACMSYVDLNPIRADMCETLQESDDTSIKQRIQTASQTEPDTHVPLASFIAGSQTKTGILFALTDYLELTDWTGRSIHPNKSGFIKPDTPKVLQQLGLDEPTWIKTVTSFKSHFHNYIGTEKQLMSISERQGKQWIRGIQLCRKLFNTTSFQTV